MYSEKLEMLIDGNWCQGGDGETQNLVNPATEEILAQVPHANETDLERAIEASARGFKVWKDFTPISRQIILEKAARLIERRADIIARTLTLEMGKPLAEAMLEIAFVVDVTRWYGEEGKRTYGRIVPSRITGARQMVVKEPVGPACAFVAWNFPGTNFIRKVAGALAAGCSILIKPSEETPGTAVAIARCFQEAGLPNGVLNMVFGTPDEVSRKVLGSPIPKKMSFTGSIPVGKHLQRLAAETLKRCTMELGGHAPLIVFDDADIENALNVSAAFKFRNAGQVCISPTRFYVQDKIYKVFIEGFKARAEAIKVGNGLEEGVQMGPLIDKRRLPIMEDFVSDAVKNGAKLEIGGERIGNLGYFYAPTVMSDVPDNSRIMNDEPFGPLAPITHFNTFDEVIERSNALPYGLAAYAFTKDGEKAAKASKALDAGIIGINHPAVSTPETPFGGVDESGYGSEGGIEGLDAFLRTKFVSELGV